MYLEFRGILGTMYIEPSNAYKLLSNLPKRQSYSIVRLEIATPWTFFCRENRTDSVPDAKSSSRPHGGRGVGLFLYI
jgi:hypothetical protein